MKQRYQFIHFEEVHDSVARVTKVYSCRNNRSGDELGEIRWYGAWRQYCYFPTVQAVYSAGCLRDIDSFVTALMDERKAVPV